MRIIGPPSADFTTVAQNAAALPSIHPRFVAEMTGPLWSAALHVGVDPVGMIAQAYKETGGGRYAGKVKPEAYNTCGLKIRYPALYPGITDGDNPLAHALFPNWEVGAMAQAQHLCGYSGQALPTGDLVVDPRYWLVVGKHWCETFEELGGRWAPSTTYGTELVTIARQLQA